MIIVDIVYNVTGFRDKVGDANKSSNGYRHDFYVGNFVAFKLYLCTMHTVVQNVH
jgi:hypothetical protein